MSRRDAVVLVTRALAFIQLISASLEISYLPGRVLFLRLYFHRVSGTITYDSLFAPELVAVLSILLRIGILLLAALVLLRCGPKLEAWLLPTRSEERPTES